MRRLGAGRDKTVPVFLLEQYLEKFLANRQGTYDFFVCF